MDSMRALTLSKSPCSLSSFAPFLSIPPAVFGEQYPTMRNVELGSSKL